MINTSQFSLPVKIVLALGKYNFRGVYKMFEIIMTGLLVILIGMFGVLSYILGKQHGRRDWITKRALKNLKDKLYF